MIVIAKTKKRFIKPDILVVNDVYYDALLTSADDENAFGIDLGDGFFGEGYNDENY